MKYLLLEVCRIPQKQKQLIRRMKTSILLLILGICTVSAHTVLSQETTLSVNLSNLSIFFPVGIIIRYLIQDLFIEVSHRPIYAENNLFLNGSLPMTNKTQEKTSPLPSV